jgi:cell division septal protein FtsQ
VGGSLVFAASIAAGLLLADATVDLATRIHPNARSVTTIAVQGLTRLDALTVARASGIEKGGDRADVDVEAVADRISAHPWIRRARVVRPPLGPLVVRIEEREPKAVLHSDGQQGWRLVDEDGTPFAPATETDLRSLPHISTSEPLASDSPHLLLAQAVALGQQAERAGLLAAPGSEGRDWYPELRIPERGDTDGWIVAARGRALEVVLGFEDLDQKLLRLAQMLTSAPKELEGVARIDLRFDDHAVMQANRPASRKGSDRRVRTNRSSSR